MTNSNTKNSMVMFTSFVFDPKYSFWANFVRKFKVNCLSRNLVQGLIPIWGISIKYVRRGGSHDEGLRVRAGGGRFKPGEYVCISTIFSIFENFLDKKMKMIAIMQVSSTSHLNS